MVKALCQLRKQFVLTTGENSQITASGKQTVLIQKNIVKIMHQLEKHYASMGGNSQSIASVRAANKKKSLIAH